MRRSSETMRGATLLEGLMAVTIAASAVALATTFALNGFAVTSDLHSQAGFDLANRRLSREFAGDLAQTTRFNLGVENESTQVPKTILLSSEVNELTVGYTDRHGTDIWVHYDTLVSATSGKTYLVKTSNQIDGVNYLSTVVAPDVENVTFTLFDANGLETTVIADIKRVDLELTLSTADVTRTLTFSGALRAANEGAVRLTPGLDFESIQEEQFVK